MKRILTLDIEKLSGCSKHFAGYEGEHLATEIKFQLPDELVNSNYNYLLMFETNSSENYFANLDFDSFSFFLPQGLTKKGSLFLQIIVQNNNELIYKSKKTELFIGDSIKLADEEVSKYVGLFDDTIAHLNNEAKILKNLPKIDTDSNWLLFDTSTGVYVNTGLPSRGMPGEQGIQGIQGIKGDKGDKGDVGNIYIPNIWIDITDGMLQFEPNNSILEFKIDTNGQLEVKNGN